MRELEAETRKVALIGVPRNSSGTTDGVARAPGALREAGLLTALSVDRYAENLGDVRFDPPRPQRDARSGTIVFESSLSMIADGFGKQF